MRLHVAIAGLIVGTIVSVTETMADDVFTPPTKWINSFSEQTEDDNVKTAIFRFQNLDVAPAERLVSYESLGNQCAANNCEQSCIAGSNCCESGWGIGGGFEFGAEGWGDRADDDEAANHGIRYGINLGIASKSSRLGFQIGVLHGLYDLNGRYVGNENRTEQQFAVTTGVFRRSNVCCGERISAGIVWDYLHDNAYSEPGDDIDLNQLRYQVGYAVNQYNELGFWGASGLSNDTIDSDNDVVHIVTQLAGYWDHVWENGGRTRVLLGWADGHGNFVMGLRGTVPLNNHIAAYGNLHYIPTNKKSGSSPRAYADDNYSVAAGFVITFGPAVQCDISGHYADPLMPLITNGTFAKTLDGSAVP